VEVTLNRPSFFFFFFALCGFDCFRHFGRHDVSCAGSELGKGSDLGKGSG
jgi:hypothetical protein